MTVMGVQAYSRNGSDTSRRGWADISSDNRQPRLRQEGRNVAMRSSVFWKTRNTRTLSRLANKIIGRQAVLELLEKQSLERRVQPATVWVRPGLKGHVIFAGAWLSHEGEGGLAPLPLDAEQFGVAYGIAFGLQPCRRVAAAIFAANQIEDRIGLAARHRLAELDAAVGLDQTAQGLRRTSTSRSRRSWPLPRRADFLE
ncbi:hypothetical protein [Mesorhizobium sp. M00.F.Ca.ET.216.01.1.1]|uniref:hypothetical protein n=1 Tax=Mesorhizobium sp. M00.F.Ca.ET.216.01.1.1 TaxID=2500528 RepID=UPI00167A5BB2|nr:hypothetical protein [Mesorhizobium sp. M00.F.Ca.ET.216.01.1.1]